MDDFVVPLVALVVDAANVVAVVAVAVVAVAVVFVSLSGCPIMSLVELPQMLVLALAATTSGVNSFAV